MSDTESVLRDRYRLVRPIRRSRASATWEAVDEETGARCVVKELSVGAALAGETDVSSYDTDDFTKVVDLFEREARVLAHLEHPGIPRLIDHFRLDVGGETRLYTVQELVEGDTLEELVAAGRHFTEEEAVRICREVAEVLGHLHGRSPPLVHRDVKPSNIILDADGEVHLVDFGSVRTSLDARAGQTIVGTYGYMPMEQYEARAVPQSDFYALGMTLVFVLSHRDPTSIPRTGMALDFRSHVNVSDRFARLIGWMIAAAPEDRPPSAEAIVEALDPGRLQLPDLLPTAPSPTRTSRTGILAARKGAALVIGVLGVLLSLWGLLRGGMPFDAAPAASLDGDDGAGRPERTVGARIRPAVGAVDGVLTIDLDRDFEYVATGWPMGRSVGQTTYPTPSRNVPRGVDLPELEMYDQVFYGVLPLGNAGAQIDYALVDDRGAWSLFLDTDDDGDLRDEGPPRPNEGSGPMLATLSTVDVTVRLDDSSELVRPYGLWLWFTERGAAAPTARGYARHHYRGVLRLGDEEFDATVFEYLDHDALYRGSGVCIDLDRSGECTEETELFHDGDLIAVGGGSVRLRLFYP